MLNLDTHILVYFLSRSLSLQEFQRMAREDLAISDIVLWELAMLERAGRLSIDLDEPAFHSFLHTLRILPITLEVARQSTNLDFISDPADEIIAATSIVEKIPLLTRDRRILRSRIVPFAL
jgi:PIN domain nuclease of toxin-antitoxin system